MSRSVTVRLPDDLYAAASRACERRKIDMTTFVVDAVRTATLNRLPPEVRSAMAATPANLGPVRPKYGELLKGVKK